MKCEKCGQVIENHVKFCPYCGTLNERTEKVVDKEHLKLDEKEVNKDNQLDKITSFYRKCVSYVKKPQLLVALIVFGLLVACVWRLASNSTVGVPYYVYATEDGELILKDRLDDRSKDVVLTDRFNEKRVNINDVIFSSDEKYLYFLEVEEKNGYEVGDLYCYALGKRESAERIVENVLAGEVCFLEDGRILCLKVEDDEQILCVINGENEERIDKKVNSFVVDDEEKSVYYYTYETEEPFALTLYEYGLNRDGDRKKIDEDIDTLCGFRYMRLSEDDANRIYKDHRLTKGIICYYKGTGNEAVSTGEENIDFYLMFPGKKPQGINRGRIDIIDLSVRENDGDLTAELYYTMKYEKEFSLYDLVSDPNRDEEEEFLSVYQDIGAEEYSKLQNLPGWTEEWDTAWDHAFLRQILQEDTFSYGSNDLYYASLKSSDRSIEQEKLAEDVALLERSSSVPEMKLFFYTKVKDKLISIDDEGLEYRDVADLTNKSAGLYVNIEGREQRVEIPDGMWFVACKRWGDEKIIVDFAEDDENLDDENLSEHKLITYQLENASLSKIEEIDKKTQEIVLLGGLKSEQYQFDVFYCLADVSVELGSGRRKGELFEFSGDDLRSKDFEVNGICIDLELAEISRSLYYFKDAVIDESDDRYRKKYTLCQNQGGIGREISEDVHQVLIGREFVTESPKTQLLYVNDNGFYSWDGEQKNKIASGVVYAWCNQAKPWTVAEYR